MYSGGSDSNEESLQKIPSSAAAWSLNPSAYRNMSNEQVDWAALAQQWIIMKEAGPPPVPTAEKGEAPMDVVGDERDEGPIAWSGNETLNCNMASEPPPPPPGAEPWTWNAQNQNWSWNNEWVPTPPPPDIKGALLPTPPDDMFHAPPPESASDNAVHFSGYTPPPGTDLNNSTSSTGGAACGGYWTASGATAAQSAAAAAAAAAAAMKHIKPHNKRYSKVNVPVRVTAPLPPATVAPPPVEIGTNAVANVMAAPPPLDAAKRKQLPAWIREGLEKMEKDKLKQMEKEKEKREREEMLEKSKEKEQETMEILKTTMKERQKSKFESDGENSEDEPIKVSRSTTPEAPPLTQDELMLKVRRTMTEILLNVTTKLIESVCKEEHQRHIRKQKASDQRSAAPRGGANISARLGLGEYGDDSEASSQDEDDGYKQVSKDSDEELKDTIKRKLADFQKIEREIDDKLEDLDRKKIGSDTPDSVDNDSQVDANRQDSKRQKSPPPQKLHQEKISKKTRSPSYSDSDTSNSYSKLSRLSRSSSSGSNDSYARAKKKYRKKKSSSRSKSRTPKISKSSTKASSRRETKKRSERRRSRSRSRTRSRSRSYRKSSRSKRSRSRRSRSRSRYSNRKEESRRGRRSRSRGSRSKRSRSGSDDGRGKRRARR